MVKNKRTKTLPITQRVENLDERLEASEAVLRDLSRNYYQDVQERNDNSFAKEKAKRDKQMQIMYYVYYGLVAFVVIISLIKLKKGQ